MPWLTWQAFRRTHTALPYLLGIEFREYAVPGGGNRFIGS
jgi:hypothetical protein